MLDPDRIKKQYEKNPDGLSLWVMHNHRDFFSYIKEKYNGRNFSERLYKYVYGDKEERCNLDGCDNKCKFQTFGKGYGKYCSKKCLNKYLSSDEVRAKVEKTHKKRYGGIGYASNQLKKKSYSTTKKLYGSNIFSASKNHRSDLINNQVDQIFEGDRLEDHIEPSFDRVEYDGIGYYKKYSFRCLKCDEEFYDHLYHGHSPLCPNCDKQNTVSDKEREFSEFLEEIYNGEIIRNDQSVLDGRRELDFYLPNEDLAIEFNGLYWHSELNGIGRNYHLNKTNVCESQGIQLIHLFENYWDSNKWLVKQRFKHLLGLSSRNIHARKTHLKEIGTNEKQEFLKRYHLDGPSNSSIKYGLFLEGELVSVMTFSKKRSFYNNQNENGDVWEIVRFASKCNVMGAGGKLFKNFVRNEEPEKVISFADRCWSYSKTCFYKKLGFELIAKTRPTYWYFKSHYPIYHRYTFQKSVLNEKLDHFDSELSEWENMKMNGWNRFWDCGNLKFEFSL